MSFAQMAAHKPTPEAPFEFVQVRVLAKPSLPSDTAATQVQSLYDKADSFCRNNKLEPHPVKSFVDAEDTPTKRLYAAPEGSSRALAVVERSVARSVTLEQRLKLVEEELAQTNKELAQMKKDKKDEDDKARDRRSATVIVSTAQALNAAFGCGGESARRQLKNVFVDYRDRGTTLGSTVCTLNADVKRAFEKNPSWEGQVDLRNSEAHPSPGSDLLLELLELEDKNVPLAREAITFLLLAVRQRHLVNSKRDSVQDVMEEMREISTAFPTAKQQAWLQRLELGV